LIGLEVLEDFSESFNPRIYADDCNARRQNCMYWWRRGRVGLRSETRIGWIHLALLEANTV
jgi:hypothetical protein